MMLWLAFAILTAFSESIKDVLNKRLLTQVNEYLLAWSLVLFALPWLVLSLFFTGIPPLKTEFWSYLIIDSILNIVANLLYIRAIKHGDLSSTVPIINFTPLFLIVTSPLILGERLNIFGCIGVLLVLTGSYFINFQVRDKGYLYPFHMLLKEKGPRTMLCVALIWSITSTMDKIGVINSSSFFWAISLNICIFALMSLFLLHNSKVDSKKINHNLKDFVFLGFFYALGWLAQMTAISLISVAYVISIKRSSTLISVILGYLLFKESNIKWRLPGATIMFVGFLVLALS